MKLNAYKHTEGSVVFTEPNSEEDKNYNRLSCKLVMIPLGSIDLPIESAQEELKPCPHCGGEPILEENKDIDSEDSIYSVGCRNNCIVYETSKEQAIARWNKRWNGGR